MFHSDEALAGFATGVVFACGFCKQPSWLRRVGIASVENATQ